MMIRRLNRQFVLGFVLAAALCVGVWGIHKWVKIHGTLNIMPVPAHVKNFDVMSLIDIKTSRDVDEMRAQLSTLLWGSEYRQNMHRAGLRVDTGYHDDRYDGMDNLSRLDRVTVDMDYGINSVVYYFNPVRSNGQLILFNEGHDGDFIYHKKFLATLLAQGFHVAALAMPLMGMNSQPVLNLQGIGPVKLEAHDALSYVDRKNGHPARFFLEPVIRVLDYATARERFSRITMIGFSGGGWTTVMAAALDPRIDWSFPIAGTWPLFLKTGWTWGDWEQWDRNIYGVANYLELYVMGASGKGRMQVQMLNEFDSCCNGGEGWTVYDGVVRKAVGNVGAGEFHILMDPNGKRHAISDYMVTYLLRHLK
jgi:hypothetical protein